MTTPPFETPSASRLTIVMRALRALFRAKYRADFGGQKLPPISDIVQRAGREPPAPE